MRLPRPTRPAVLIRGGFTVVEVLVASVIAATLLLGVYGVFYQALHAEGRASVRWQSFSSAAAVADHLAQALERCVNLPQIPALVGRPGPQEGGYELLCTVTAQGPQSTGGGPCAERLRYRWSQRGSTAAVSLSLQSLPYAGKANIMPAALAADPAALDEQQLWQAAPIELIGQGLDELSVRYRPASDPQAQWVSEWSGPAAQALVWIRVRSGDQVVERYVVPRASAELLREGG